MISYFVRIDLVLHHIIERKSVLEGVRVGVLLVC